MSASQQLAALVKPRDGFVEIAVQGNVVVSTADSRAALERIGLSGEILHTPGHSEDSVSLLLDDGSVFTGDLTAPAIAAGEEREVARASWDLLRRRGAATVYPGHGAPGPLRLPWAG